LEKSPKSRQIHGFSLRSHCARTRNLGECL